MARGVNELGWAIADGVVGASTSPGHRAVGPAAMRARWGLAVGLGLGAAVLCGQGVAAAAPDTAPGASSGSARGSSPASARESSGSARPRSSVSPRRAAPVAAPGASSASAPEFPVLPRPAAAQPDRTQAQVRPATPAPRTAPAAAAVRPARSAAQTVSVDLPPMPVTRTRAFTVSQEAITDAATAYVDGGGDPADAPRFFFGDLATGSLDILASRRLTRDQVRVEMGNLAVSGYFGGIWLRDNLRAVPAESPGTASPRSGGVISAIGLRMFSVLAGALSGVSSVPLLSRPTVHASVPVLLTLYGYNKGYLEFLLDNPPPGVPSMRDTLTCNGFLGCNSTLVDLEIANRYDGALIDLQHPPTLRWVEMKLWTSVLETTTAAGRFVWKIIGAGGFSPDSYAALVDLSSAYLMISKAATLASMQTYADRDSELAPAALLLQAGLWMWSGAYFSGLASNAPAGTIPSIVVSSS